MARLNEEEAQQCGACQSSPTGYCDRHENRLSVERVATGKHLVSQQIELAPEQWAALTCPSASQLHGLSERREWLDEFEEAGWTKIVTEDGSVQYERPCNGAREWRLYRAGGGVSSGRPIDPKIVARMPVLKEKKRRWWQFWKSDQWQQP